MLTTRELLKRLRNLQDELNQNFEYINHGGCAVVAAMVGECLEELGVPCDVVTNGGAVPAKIRQHVWDKTDVRAWDDSGLWRGHLAIRFKIGNSVRIWDSDGMYGSQLFGYSKTCKARGKFGEGLTVEECAAISMRENNSRSWNSTFDRRQVPAMREVVERCLFS